MENLHNPMENESFLLFNADKNMEQTRVVYLHRVSVIFLLFIITHQRDGLLSNTRRQNDQSV